MRQVGERPHAEFVLEAGRGVRALDQIELGFRWRDGGEEGVEVGQAS